MIAFGWTAKLLRTFLALSDGHIDISAFYDKYKNDSVVRYANGPAIVLGIILFVYSNSITISREVTVLGNRCFT